MNKIILAFIVLLIDVPVFGKEPIKTLECMTERVLDGNTFSCGVKSSGGTFVKIRLYGINAPEGDRRHYKSGKFMKLGQAYGDQATSALTHKIGNNVITTVKVYDIDRYKRLLGMVFIGTRNINQEMVAEGHAWAYRQYLDTPYRSEFITSEEQARGKKLGLWQDANPEPPWEFRHKKKIAGDE